MAQSQTGKWVSRVGSTGGGRNYKSRRPLNFYGVLTIIVVLGLLSVFWARHEYRSGSSTSAGTPPLVGTTQYSALGFDICGTIQSALPAGTNATTAQLALQANGVVRVAPTTKAYAGTNANISKLADTYAGLVITSNSIQLPASGNTKAVNFTNGQACPTGTPDAGKTGTMVFSYWPNFASKATVTTTNPSKIRFTANSLVTVAFIPTSASAAKPTQSSISAMLQAAQSGSTTPTTATPTTIPQIVTTTTAPATTTTASATTTSK